MKIKCVVSCRNAGGEPDFFPAIVELTQEQYDEGEHYEKADDEAAGAGYDTGYLVYDENDGPSWLFAHFAWNKVKAVKI